MIVDINIFDALSEGKSLVKVLSLVAFPCDEKKRTDYELGMLVGLSDAGIKSIKTELLSKISLSRLIETIPLNTLKKEFKTREYLTIFDLVNLMIRANVTGGIIQQRNSLNRAVSVLSKSYDEEPNLKRIHGLHNIIKTWGKYKSVAHFIFAYTAFIEILSDRDTTHSILMTILLLANYAGISLKSIKTLKLDGQMYELPEALSSDLSKFPIPFPEGFAFNANERKEWLAYRAHYESKPKKGEEE